MSDDNRTSQTRRVNKWLLAVLAVIALGTPLWMAVRSAREAALRMQRTNRMRQVLLGFHNFHDVYKRLPQVTRVDREGRPLSSWRFQLLPFLRSVMVDIDYDQPWDAVDNIRWVGHANEFDLDLSTSDRSLAPTNIMAITGPGTAFEEGKTVRLRDMDRDTILIVEVPDSDICWMEPGDLHVDDVDQSLMNGTDGRGVHVGWMDASVWYLRADTPVSQLRKFLTIDSAKKYDREKELARYKGGL